MVLKNGLVILFLTTAVFGEGLKKELYERVLFYWNLKGTNIPLTSPSSVDSIHQCAQLCLGEPGCRYPRLDKGTCFLFESTPENTGGLQEVVFSLSADECPISEGYISVSSPRMCFKLSEEIDMKTWSDSQIECQENGGRLMVLNTDAKHDYIYKYNTRIGLFSAFVGMEKVGGVFKWTDGTDYMKQWADGEPDYVSWQNCGSMHPGGLGDLECHIPKRYLCEVVITE